jgi:hypothetical protein
MVSRRPGLMLLPAATHAASSGLWWPVAHSGPAPYEYMSGREHMSHSNMWVQVLCSGKAAVPTLLRPLPCTSGAARRGWPQRGCPRRE